MQKINWENGTVVKDAFVTINGTEYPVTPKQMEGTTPLSADNLNLMQNNIEDSLPEDITTGGDGVKCGYKIDGKDVFVKRISVGSLPNNTSKSVATGINFSNYTLMKIEGIVKYNSNNIAFPIPFAHPTNLANSIMVNIDNSNNLVITTASDRSTYNGTVNIYYY